MAKLGDFLVQYTYRVERSDRDEVVQLLTKIADHAEELGLASFEAWSDDGDEGTFTELHGYDSWSHWKRLADRGPDPSMRSVYERLDALIIGGMAAIEARQWRPLSV